MKAQSPINLLCLDFDGVICNSMYECMLVAYNAYFDKHSVSIEMLPEDYREFFRMHRYLVRDPGEYFILVDQWMRGRALTASGFAEDVIAQLAEIKSFKTDFFVERRYLREKNIGAWIACNPLYQAFVDFLCRDKTSKCIVTTKDEESVNLILNAYGLTEEPIEIFGQRALTIYGGKRGAIIEACARYATAPERAVFVDDHLQHLLDVKEIGVNLRYATWGYCDPGLSLEHLPEGILPLFIDNLSCW